MFRNALSSSLRSARPVQSLATPSRNVKKAFASTYLDDKKQHSKKSNAWAVVGVAALAASAIWGYQMVDETRERRKISPSKPKVNVVMSPLDPKKFIGFPLKKVTDINHNTKKFTFELPDLDEALGLPVASCLVTRIPKPDGEKGAVIRPYTPTSTDAQKGEFDLVIKHYKNGPMSEHIFAMKEGDVLDFKGPIPKFKYEPAKYDNIGMVAGGTGLTPMLQVIQAVLNNPEDKTKITFIFANQEERDILLKKELDAFAKSNPDRFKVVYTLDKPPSKWTGEKGRVSKEMVQKYLPGTDGKNIILVCGPQPMMAAISGDKTPDFKQGEVGGILKQLGYTSDQVYKF